MKLKFTVTYLTPAGKEQRDNVEITLGDFAAWERKTGRRVQDLATGMGINDMGYLCWHRLHKSQRETRDYETWMESLQLIESQEVDRANPTEQAP
jgi:hypothetical protein